MSLSVINYDPPSQQIPNLRTVYKIPKGISVIPSSIKLLNISITPLNASGNRVASYLPCLAGIWASVSQIELKVNDKPVDLFLSKQMSAFKNSLGNPDFQNNIVSKLTGSNNNIFQDLDLNRESLIALPADIVPQCMEFRLVLDYLNNRYLIDEGLSIQITWDTQRLDWLLPGADAETPAGVNIVPGYLSYESVMNYKVPEQNLVNFKQTIEEAIIIPNITSDDTQQLWEQRMNSLRDKFITRCLFVNEPIGQNSDIQNVKNTYGRYCSMGMLNEYLNIVIDGQQKLTFKGFSNPAHKLGMCYDVFGVGSSSTTSWFLPKLASLVDDENNALDNYYSYMGAEFNTFVNKEVVIQYNRTSTTASSNPSMGSQLKLYMISEVLKEHNTKTGVCTYVKH